MTLKHDFVVSNCLAKILITLHTPKACLSVIPHVPHSRPRQALNFSPRFVPLFAMVFYSPEASRCNVKCRQPPSLVDENYLDCVAMGCPTTAVINARLQFTVLVQKFAFYWYHLDGRVSDLICL